MKTAAAYIRVSDERQDEFSPDSQIKLIREYCQKNDIELPNELIFYDDGISAKSAKNRTQFNEMIALAKLKDKPFQMILVWKFSRFARNQEESIVYKSLLRKNGVEVISVSEPLSDNPFGGLIERIIEWMDEYYLIRLGDEVRRGMTERATRGLPNVAPPLGYRMVNGTYEIDEEEAEAVRTIFQLFVNGTGIRGIASYLGALGVKSKPGNPLDSRGVEYILHNPCYMGYLRWNPHGKSASKRCFNNPDDILTKADHTPIISEELFQQAQLLLEERAKTKQKYMREEAQVSQFALRGLVRCDACGSTLVLNQKKNGLQCCKYARGACNVSHFISLPLLNQMVLDAMKHAVQELSFPIAVEPAEKVSAVPNDFDKRIAEQQRKSERAWQAYLNGAVSINDYKRTQEQIQKQIQKYEEEKKTFQATASSVSVQQFAKTVTDLIELAENPEVSEELKNKAFRSILQKIVFYKPEKRIELFFYA